MSSPHPRLSEPAAVARVRAASPARPAFVLATGPGAVARWRAALAREGGAFASAGPLEALLVLAEDRALVAGAPPLGEAERVALVADLLRDRPEVAASFAADPQGLAALVRALCDELALHRFHAVPREGVARVTGGVIRARLLLLHDVLRAYRGEVARRGDDLVRRLERVLPALAGAPRVALTLAVAGGERLAPLERALVDALAAAGAEVVEVEAPAPAAAPGTLLARLWADPPGTATEPPDGSFVRVLCRDALEEVDVAVRIVRARLEAGVAPGRIAVQAPAGAGYADLLARAFADEGMSLAARDAVPVTATPLYQAFRAFVRLHYRGPDPFDLSALLSAGGTGVRGARRDAIARQLLRDVPSTWDGVREAIAAATRKADPPGPGEGPWPEAEVARHREARDAALAVVEVLARGPSGRRVEDPRLAAATLRDAVLWFCGGVGSAHRLAAVPSVPDRDAIQHRDAAVALRAAATLLVERAAGGDLPAAAAFRDAAAFLQAMEPVLADAEDAVSSPGAVSLRLGDAAPGPVDHLVVVGFSRGRWPTPAGASPVLGRPERAALRALGGSLAALPLPEDHAARRAADARAALGQAARELVVLSPARGELGGEAPPALLLVDLLRRLRPAALRAWQAAHEVRAGTATAGAWLPALGSDLPPRASPREAARALARALGGDSPLPPVGRAALAALAGSARAAPLAARFRPDADFALPVHLDVAARELSASQLEALLSCRYRYFSRYVLDLHRLELSRAPALGVATKGTIAHEVLEALGARLTAADDAEVREALRRVLAERHPWALAPRYRADVAGVERDLLRFVPAYQAVLRGLDWRAGASEVHFGERHGRPVAYPLDPGQPGALRALGVDRLRLQGSVDRVDEVVVAGRAFRLVTDFKFGNVAKFAAQRTAGLGLQAALYPHALAELGGPPTLGFAYCSLSSRAVNLLPSAGAALPPLDGRVEVDTNDLEGFQREVRTLLTARLALLVGATRSGGVGDASPHSAEERARLATAKVESCRYCEGQLLCRFREDA